MPDWTVAKPQRRLQGRLQREIILLMLHGTDEFYVPAAHPLRKAAIDLTARGILVRVPVPARTRRHWIIAEGLTQHDLRVLAGDAAP